MNSTAEQLKATFQDALRRPDRPAAAPAVEHGPTAGRRPDRSLFVLALDRIRPDPNQVRSGNKTAEDAEVRELAESIKAVGLENPLTVRYLRDEDVYQLIAGERRFAAATLAGLTEVPVKLHDVDEKTARRIQLHENIHRASLTPLELTAAIEDALADGDTPETLARLLCKSTAYVQKFLTISRRLSPAARKIVQAHPQQFSSMDVLYDVAQTSSEQHETLLLRIRDEGLTRAQVRTVTAPLKAAAKQKGGTRRGRRAQPKAYCRKIELPDQVTVSVTFPRPQATSAEVLSALEEAVKTVRRLPQ